MAFIFTHMSDGFYRQSDEKSFWAMMEVSIFYFNFFATGYTAIKKTNKIRKETGGKTKIEKEQINPNKTRHKIASTPLGYRN